MDGGVRGRAQDVRIATEGEPARSAPGYAGCLIPGHNAQGLSPAPDAFGRPRGTFGKL